MKIFPRATLLILGTSLFLSCKTVDLEPRNETSKGIIGNGKKGSEAIASNEQLPAEIEINKQIVYVEQPIYIPTPEAPLPEKKGGVDSVKESTEKGTIKPSDYSHASRIYIYDSDQVYEVYCQILRTTDIYLEPGEIVIDKPFVSDSDRWIIGAGVNQQNGTVVQHIYLQPKLAGLESSLIINTSYRVYHVTLKSFNSVYMPIVKWEYLDNGFPQNYIQDIGKEKGKEQITNEMELMDPRYLSFDYKIRFNIFNKPKWLPKRVYDDGKKTYIVFDEQTLQMELPGVFENKADVVNYRVNANVMVIDKLIEKLTIKYKKQTITIEKKRSK